MGGASGAGDGPAILLVDDVPANLVALTGVLAPLVAEHGLRVITASTADEALRHALAEGGRLAVIVLDVMMPGTDGPALARLIRARRQTAHVPVLFVTALDAERRRLTEAYQSGAVDYLTKPLEPSVIRAKVAAFVALHRTRAEQEARERRRFADQARAEVDATRARLALVLDSLPDAVSVFDRQWRYLYVNPAAAEIQRAAGLAPEAVLGQVLWDVLPELRGTRLEAEFRRAVAEGCLVTYEEHVERLDQWIERRLIPAPDGTCTVISRDVTAQRRAAAALRASERRLAGLVDETAAARAAAEDANAAKSRFLAAMSHELRTPLNAIIGHVALVEDEVYGPVTAGQRDALARVRRAQQHLLTLIRDVLDLSKLEAGHVEYTLEPVRLASVMAEATTMLEPQAAAARLALEVRLPDDSLEVWADVEKLRQIVLNLLGNSMKFTLPGGRVWLELVEPVDAPDVVHLRVHDTGIGIPAAQLGRVFEPFVQVHDRARAVLASAGRADGTGLGLAISRDLARGMGGDLTVESTEGVGSTFTVVLRRAVLPSGEPTDRRSPDERRAGDERRSGDDRRDPR
ncbi:ATP-binding response regulator [Roseisolibacter agri]|uniref:ATP-binding response regulator n=1 Tax=Roseisolibacter agri TaxID=2014610 RepID=UPI0024E0F09A|nr:ATP-binding protein [Roseisolibacter agri]